MVFLKSALSRITQFVATLSTSMHHRGSINAAVRSDDPAIIVPHLSPTNPEDDTMRALNRNIPVSVQHFVRDKGVMRFLADNSALMAAATLGASQPSLLYRFMDAGKCMKNYKYGDIKGQNCQVFNFDAYTSEHMPTNLIQAQRDYFGAHTYERIDKEGKFHTEWNSEAK